jgi:predicted small secreted protein
MARWIAAVAAAMLLAGCNTMAGMGKDIQKAGETIEGAARKK